ncbi:uncharacterized protein LOC130455485 [Monodelphis domestica]|uniref:uncharacterized protein LOC130455485 n=1 Tax=Monodelphis domestica TaxID=13616 RepID=UPI0024E26617|nr:uncharacterized protein LOC130455485 [Monodelphis domestica]XP_056661093.1 uncharacterized protein LOC130455485 [Monodelphis domestica]
MEFLPTRKTTMDSKDGLEPNILRGKGVSGQSNCCDLGSCSIEIESNQKELTELYMHLAESNKDMNTESVVMNTLAIKPETDICCSGGQYESTHPNDNAGGHANLFPEESNKIEGKIPIFTQSNENEYKHKSQTNGRVGFMIINSIEDLHNPIPSSLPILNENLKLSSETHSETDLRNTEAGDIGLDQNTKPELSTSDKSLHGIEQNPKNIVIGFSDSDSDTESEGISEGVNEDHLEQMPYQFYKLYEEIDEEGDLWDTSEKIVYLEPVQTKSYQDYDEELFFGHRTSCIPLEELYASLGVDNEDDFIDKLNYMACADTDFEWEGEY